MARCRCVIGTAPRGRQPSACVMRESNSIALLLKAAKDHAVIVLGGPDQLQSSYENLVIELNDVDDSGETLNMIRELAAASQLVKHKLKPIAHAHNMPTRDESGDVPAAHAHNLPTRDEPGDAYDGLGDGDDLEAGEDDEIMKSLDSMRALVPLVDKNISEQKQKVVMRQKSREESHNSRLERRWSDAGLNVDLQTLGNPSELLFKARCKELFHQVDMDGDNAISIEELKLAVQAWQPNAHKVYEWILKYDWNGSKDISVDEFTELMKNEFGSKATDLEEFIHAKAEEGTITRTMKVKDHEFVVIGNSPHLFLPFDPGTQIFELLVTVALLVTLITTPMTLAFEEVEEGLTT